MIMTDDDKREDTFIDNTFNHKHSCQVLARKTETLLSARAMVYL